MANREILWKESGRVFRRVMLQGDEGMGGVWEKGGEGREGSGVWISVSWYISCIWIRRHSVP